MGGKLPGEILYGGKEISWHDLKKNGKTLNKKRSFLFPETKEQR